MKYDKETTDRLVAAYAAESATADQKCLVQKLAAQFSVPERSIRAKLSSLGLYHRKEYTNKRGEIPRKKEEIIDSLAEKLDVASEILESLEKCNKNVLLLLEKALMPKTDEISPSDPNAPTDAVGVKPGEYDFPGEGNAKDDDYDV